MRSTLILHWTDGQIEAKRSDFSKVIEPKCSRTEISVYISWLPVQCSFHWTRVPVPVIKWVQLHRDDVSRDGFIRYIFFGKTSSWISLSTLKCLPWASEICGHCRSSKPSSRGGIPRRNREPGGSNMPHSSSWAPWPQCGLGNHLPKRYDFQFLESAVVIFSDEKVERHIYLANVLF